MYTDYLEVIEMSGLTEDPKQQCVIIWGFRGYISSAVV